MNHSVPAALTIAGSDCSGGAGIQADLKTFQHFHAHGLTAVTCVVSETARIVRAVHPVPPAILADQISLLLASFPVAAIKTGMLVSAAHVRTVARLLSSHREIPLVVDPVMIASSGASLLEEEALETYHRDLLPLATLITPNLPEAEKLLGKPIPDLAAMPSAALELSKMFHTAVLLKGGHLPGDQCTDILACNQEVTEFHGPRLEVAASHGTGCTLSAAIAAGLAHGRPLIDSIRSAKRFLGETLRTSYSFHLPSHPTLHALNQATLFPQNET